MEWIWPGFLVSPASSQESFLCQLGEYLEYHTARANEFGNQGFSAKGDLFDLVLVNTYFLSGSERNPA